MIIVNHTKEQYIKIFDNSTKEEIRTKRSVPLKKPGLFLDLIKNGIWSREQRIISYACQELWCSNDTCDDDMVSMRYPDYVLINQDNIGEFMVEEEMVDLEDVVIDV